MSNKSELRIKYMIAEKMKILHDFGVCSRYDKAMEDRLANAIAQKPDKDPREVLDYYCRPMIQAAVNKWQ